MLKPKNGKVKKDELYEMNNYIERNFIFKGVGFLLEAIIIYFY